MNEQGIDNYIFYSANHKSDYPQGIMIGSKPMLRLHQLLSRIFGDQGFHSYFATRKLVRDIKRISPDVILLHNIHGYYLHLSVLFRFLREYNKPVLWTLHDCWAFTGHCCYYTMAQCDRWKSGCGNCPQKNAYPYSLIFDRSRGLFKKKSRLFCSVKNLSLITPSQWLSDEVGESFHNYRKRFVIRNGVDLSVFHPVKSGFREKNNIGNRIIVLGVASVWSKAKGLDTFIELANRLSLEKYAIVMVGTDASVDAMLPENIISIHRTSDQRELAEIYTSADVFVNPTLQDNYPTVNLEAQSCGTPVITFDKGGCAETVAEGCGTVLSEHTVDAVISELNNTRRKTEKDEKLISGLAAVYDENRCFEEYVRLCRSVYMQTGESEC